MPDIPEYDKLVLNPYALDILKELGLYIVLSLKSITANRNDWLATDAKDISLTTGGAPAAISLTYGWTNCGY